MKNVNLDILQGKVSNISKTNEVTTFYLTCQNGPNIYVKIQCIPTTNALLQLSEDLKEDNNYLLTGTLDTKFLLDDNSQKLQETIIFIVEDITKV